MAEETFDWGDLRVFLAIARERTLGAAGRRLGLSQPTAGRRLRALEGALGQTLFQRTVDGFVLTDEGRSLLRHAERVEEETNAAMRGLGVQGGRLEGTLRIASSDWFGAHILSPVLADFAGRHPDVELELLTDSRFYSLAHREADLAIRIQPFRDPHVVSRRLLRVVYGAYLKRGLPRPRPGDGAGARLVTMNAAFENMPDAVWLRRVLPRASVAARSNNRDVQARLCAQGVGLAVLPRALGDGLEGVDLLDLGEVPPHRDAFLGFHRDLRRLARLRAFVDLAVRRLGRLGRLYRPLAPLDSQLRQAFEVARPPDRQLGWAPEFAKPPDRQLRWAPEVAKAPDGQVGQASGVAKAPDRQVGQAFEVTEPPERQIRQAFGVVGPLGRQLELTSEVANSAKRQARPASEVAEAAKRQVGPASEVAEPAGRRVGPASGVVESSQRAVRAGFSVDEPSQKAGRTGLGGGLRPHGSPGHGVTRSCHAQTSRFGAQNPTLVGAGLPRATNAGRACAAARGERTLPPAGL